MDRAQRRHPRRRRRRRAPAAEGRSRGQQEKQLLQDELDDSFPASDPPASTQPTGKEPPAPKPRRRRIDVAPPLRPSDRRLEARMGRKKARTVAGRSDRRRARARARRGPGRHLPGLGPADRHPAGAHEQPAQAAPRRSPSDVAAAESRRPVRRADRDACARHCCSAIAAGAFIATIRRSGKRRWASRQWICCVLQFKNRHHPVWRDRYTALFFLDEVTALRGRPPALLRMPPRGRESFRRKMGAGEGRRRSARARDGSWCCRANGSTAARSGRMTCRSTICRTARSSRWTSRCAYAVRGSHLLRWSESGYAEKIARPQRCRDRAHAAEHRRGSAPATAAMASERAHDVIPALCGIQRRRAARQRDASLPRFTLRSVEAGNFASLSAGRIGRRTSSPPQFGQRPFSTPSAQALQNVHSNEHIIASRDSGGRSRSQHSQFGRSASMSASLP